MHSVDEIMVRKVIIIYKYVAGSVPIIGGVVECFMLFSVLSVAEN